MDEVLLRQQQICNEQISAVQRQIAALEREISSLRSFKTNVSSSQDMFQSANSRKSAVLSDLQPFTNNARCTDRFYTGMSHSLTGIGMKMVGVTFVTLKLSVDTKIASYEIKKKGLQTSLVALRAEKAALEETAKMRDVL